jgi:hypothetical protein
VAEHLLDDLQALRQHPTGDPNGSTYLWRITRHNS